MTEDECRLGANAVRLRATVHHELLAVFVPDLRRDRRSGDACRAMLDERGVRGVGLLVGDDAKGPLASGDSDGEDGLGSGALK